jgi:osmoprotectant transport system substrate-binding protein
MEVAMKARFVLIPGLVLIISLLARPCVSQGKEAIIIGGKNFTEQYILAELAKNLLEKHGLRVRLKTGVGSAVVRQSLVNDQIDLYYEYTGTAYTVYYKQSNRDIMTDQQNVYAWVKEADAQKGLIWLKPVEFNNTYTLMMREKQAKRLGIKTISELSAYMNDHPGKLVIGVNAEFWERPDGFKPLMKTYGFEVPYDTIRKMQSGLVYKALKDKNVDVSMGFATDGRITAFGFTTLEDHKSYFPVYNPAPVVREQVLQEHPEIREILQPIADKLTTEEMQELNSAVDVQHKDVTIVTRDWLKKKGLL